MTLSAAPPRAPLCALAAAAILLALPAVARADTPEAGNFDARAAGPAASAVTGPGARARAALRDRLGRLGALSLDDRTGTLRAVSRLDGFLTAPSTRDGAAVALGYVREHATAFGLDGDDLDALRLTGRATTGGLEHLTWEQRYRGIPVADAGLEAAVTGAGRLVSVTGPPAPDLALRSVEPAIGAQAAYAAARRGAGAGAAAVGVERAGTGTERATRFADGGTASLALYRGATGYRLAWRVLAPVSSTGVYDLLIDARSGATVRRANRVSFATAKVFPYSPRMSAHTTVTWPAGWLTSSSKLTGPNVYAFADRHDVVPFRPGQTGFNLIPEGGSDVAAVGGNYLFDLTTVEDRPYDACPAGAPTAPTALCTWDTDLGTGGYSWSVNTRQSVTQLFHLVNVFHDHLRDSDDIDFDGFHTNPGRPVGDPNGEPDPANSDPVFAQTLDGADGGSGFPDAEHRNNANFLTLPDGQPGLLQTYLWRPPFGSYDGANDASLVFHEYAHGLSGRLVTDAAGYGALNTAQAGALGEGISDYYAMDYLVAQSLQTDGAAPDVRVGRYVDNNGLSGAVRNQPIDCEPVLPGGTNAAQCPERGTGGAGTRVDGLTYADFGAIGDGPEVHDDGEIWAQTLWSLRAALIAAHGADGVGRARNYITEGLRLAPPEPSFLDLRNATLAASPAADDPVLWSVFAKRGMGYFAATVDSDDVEPIADFTDPATLGSTGSIAGTVRDEDGAPVAGAVVGVSGLDTGLGPLNVAQTAANGAYAITGVRTDGNRAFPLVRARKAGYGDDRVEDVTVPAGGSATVPFTLTRDWSSPVFSGAVRDFSGPDNTSSGCGPGGLIDDDPRSVWGTSRAAAGQRITIELGAPVDVAGVEIDPSAGCGDDASAALGGYQVLVATARGGPFVSLATGAFDEDDLGELRPAFSGNRQAVRFVQLIARTPQSTAPGTAGAQFVDVAELQVGKVPGSPLGVAADTGGALNVGATAATLTGTVAPHGGAAQISFEYGTTAGYGAAVAAGTTPAGGAGGIPVSAGIGGLQPSTTYHYRVVAQRGSRRYAGADATFTTTAAPPPTVDPPGTPALPTALTDKALKADRKGRLKVRVRFAADAPTARKARLRILSGKRRFAETRLTVHPGQTVRKSLRLNRKGRKAIRPGRTRKVKLELRLPDGQKVTKTVKLTRRRR